MNSAASALVLLVVATTASTQFSLVASYPVLPAPSPSFSVLPNPAAPVDDIAYTAPAMGGVSPLHVVSFNPGSPQVETTSSPIGTGHVLGGDMNGDGLRDLVVVSPSSVVVLLKTTTGYAPVGPGVGLVSTPIVAENGRLVDWDGDGDLDFFYHAFVALNNGGGVLGSPVALIPAMASVYQFDVELADADGDGDYDIFFGGPPSTLYLNVSGTFVSGPVLPTFGVFCVVKFLDFDLDGIVDLWAYCKSSTQVAIVTARGLGGGAFAPSVVTPGAWLPVSGFGSNYEKIEFIDVDGNGDLEAAILTVPTFPLNTSAAFLFDVTTSGTLVPWGGGQAITTGKSEMRAGRFVPGAGMDLAFLLRSLGTNNPSWIEIHDSIAAPIAYSATVVSGDGQTATSLAPTANPVVVRVDDAATGAPAAGIGVTLWFSGGVTAQSISGFTTDALGEVRFTLLGGQQTGTFSIAVLVLGEFAALLNVNVAASGSLALVTASTFPTFVGGGPVPPIVVRALQANGLPLGGATVQCAATAPMSLPPSSQTVITDADGYASIAVNPPTSPGIGTVAATLGAGPAASVATVQVGVRRLEILYPNPSLSISYVHEDGPTPLLIAADLPRPIAPTPFGGVATSVLAPLPGLVVLDGLGAFGPPDPTIVASPFFSRAYANVPTVLVGATLVFQAYGFDFSYPYPTYVFISPPVTVTL